MPIRLFPIVLPTAFIVLALCSSCTPNVSRDSAHPAIGSVVVVISFDGIRSDYLERADTPFFDRLMAEGAFSLAMNPVFPSLTFPTHVSQATGVSPDGHGITANSFYDNQFGRTLRFPGNSRLLEAEPIWNTAQRQGVRTAVVDWPLSHAQRGPHATDYHGESYERGLTDEQRIERLLAIWEQDEGDPPLRLLLGYGESPDKEGHSFGPDAPETIEAFERTDRLADRVHARLLEIWRSKNPGPGDQLYFIVTSDHGMSAVSTLVHPGNLTGLEGTENVEIVTSGNIGHVHLERIRDDERRETVIHETLTRLSEFDYVRVFRRDETPEEWNYRHARRTGDILLVLDEGYTFSRRPEEIEMPVSGAGGPLGMHGYHVAEVPAMRHPFFIYRYPDPIGPLDLGETSALQVHATIARLLDIEPAPEARDEPIEIFSLTR